VLTDQVDGQKGKVTGKDIEYASDVARDIARERNGFYVDQFNNLSGVRAHFETTGPEIWADLAAVDAFVASVGSGGTFVGTSRFLKSKNGRIKCIAVEPENAAILKTGKVLNPRHIIQGTGYGLVTVSDHEAETMTRRISAEQGLYVGYSSGANVAAAIQYASNNPEIKKVVTILCDTGYKYSGL
jgi:cysteine synthase A